MGVYSLNPSSIFAPMSHHNEDVIPDSTYPELQPPDSFQSQIPEHLLAGASKTDRFLMEQISIMRQYTDWSVKAALSQDRQSRLTNGRLRRAEADIKQLQADRASLKVGWKVIAKIVGVVVVILTLAATIIQAIK